MIYYLAVCMDCTPWLPMPFQDSSARDEWSVEHAETGHRVVNTFEVRT